MKSGEGTAAKREKLGEKLGRVGKRGGHATPIAPFWRPPSKYFLASHSQSCRGDNKDISSHSYIFQEEAPFLIPRLSARKLAANLWELHHYNLPLCKMHNGGVAGPPPRLRRLNHHQLYKDLDPENALPDLPGSSTSLRRHVAASLMQHHRSIERSNHAIQPISPASYGSSLEIAPYNPAVTPTSSIELKGRTGETSYSLRTSTELLKVLNRIWSLEEQHVANMTLVKGLKKELDHARSRVRDLMRERQSDRHEMAELMKQITEGKLVRKNKEQDRINASINSMRAELEDERKLRKRSESLHRKLARELYDVKTTLVSVSNDLEKEKKSCGLLEDLCDEFAWGIRDYGKELHSLRQKYEKDWAERRDDELILHVSEAWLDERMQMKLQAGNGIEEMKSGVQRLSSEIEAFLQARRNVAAAKVNGKQVLRDPALRSSLESIPMNMAVSAPRDEEYDDDSAGSDSNCFELEKVGESNIKSRVNGQQQQNLSDETIKQKQMKKKVGSSDKAIGPSTSHGEGIKGNEEDAERINFGQGNLVETNVSFTPDKSKTDNNLERILESEGITGLNSNYMIENLIRNHYLLSETGNTQQDKDHGLTSSLWRSHPSPVRQWTEKLPSHDFKVSASSSKLPADLKENTLKAKLYEAKTRGQRSRSRLKASIIPSGNE